MNLAGYSADGHTICFYPLGERDGNFFAQTGMYEFSITGMAANVKGQLQKRIVQVFTVELTQEMFDQIQSEPDLEYRSPIFGYSLNFREVLLIDILRSIGK